MREFFFALFCFHVEPEARASYRRFYRVVQMLDLPAAYKEQGLLGLCIEKYCSCERTEYIEAVRRCPVKKARHTADYMHRELGPSYSSS